MKKVLFITSVIAINLVLVIVFARLFNPFDLSYSKLFTSRIEFLFSPSISYNLMLIGSFIGLVSFNLSLILWKYENRKTLKKIINITNIVVINLVLATLVFRTAGFSTNPEINVILFGSLIGLISFNVNRRNSKVSQS
jgi:hypothetical protein